MADVFSKVHRSKIMARVRSKGTSPEVAVCRALKVAGYSFSRHRASLPGTPDILVDKQTAVFVNGCFWHQHQGCVAAERPRSNRKYWDKKLSSNIRRDRRTSRALRKLGFSVVTLWECQIRSRDSLVGYVSSRIDRCPQSTSDFQRRPRHGSHP